MKNKNLSTMLTAIHHKSFETLLINHYLNFLCSEPKPKNISKTIYIACASISILEKMGNKFPSQTEIDVIESWVKRYIRRKAMKNFFKKSRREEIDNQVFKAA